MAPRIAAALREREHSPSELRALLGREPLEALALALALRAPSEPILRWVSELRPVGLEISGADLLAAGVPEGPALGRALDETLTASSTGSCRGARRSSRPRCCSPRSTRSEAAGREVTFTTRQGGVSVGPYESLNLGILTADDPEHVTENRRRAAAQAGVEAERVAMGWQVHGTDLKEWTGPPPDRAYAQPGDKDLEKVDGHLTREPGIGLLVLVADCYPVALSDGEQVAMLHCGWRPLAGGIIEKAVSRFAGVPAAAVGPGIGGLLLRGGRRGAGGVLGHRGSGDRTHARSAGRDLGSARGCGRLGCAARGPLHELLARTCTSHTAATTASPAARRASSCAMDPERVRRNLERVREQIGSEVEILAAVKYVEAD